MRYIPRDSRNQQDRLEMAERVLRGSCPRCGHTEPQHSVECLIKHENLQQELQELDMQDRLDALKAKIPLSRLMQRLQQVSKRDV